MKNLNLVTECVKYITKVELIIIFLTYYLLNNYLLEVKYLNNCVKKNLTPLFDILLDLSLTTLKWYSPIDLSGLPSFRNIRQFYGINIGHWGFHTRSLKPLMFKLNLSWAPSDSYLFHTNSQLNANDACHLSMQTLVPMDFSSHIRSHISELILTPHRFDHSLSRSHLSSFSPSHRLDHSSKWHSVSTYISRHITHTSYIHNQ